MDTTSNASQLNVTEVVDQIMHSVNAQQQESLRIMEEKISSNSTTVENLAGIVNRLVNTLQSKQGLNAADSAKPSHSTSDLNATEVASSCDQVSLSSRYSAFSK